MGEGEDKYPVDPRVQWCMDIMDQEGHNFEAEVWHFDSIEILTISLQYTTIYNTWLCVSFRLQSPRLKYRKYRVS